MVFFNLNSSAYIRPVKINIDSADAIDTKVNEQNGTYEYKIRLDDTFDRIIGVNVTGWNIRNLNTVPFSAGDAFTTANNNVYFSISIKLPPPNPGTWTTVYIPFPMTWPEVYYTDPNPNPNFDYMTQLASLLHERLSKHTTGSSYEFSVYRNSNNKIEIKLSPGPTGTFIESRLEFLFASGGDDTAHAQMGFEKLDYVGIGDGASSIITTPFEPQLDVYRYIDVSLREFPEYTPLKRIFFPTDLYTNFDENNTFSIITSNSPKMLRELNVILALQGKEGELPAEVRNNHDLVITLYILSPEISIPDWMEQVINL